MNTTDLRQQIADALAGFKGKDLKQAGMAFLNTLGYRSEKVLDLDNTPEAFLAQFDRRDRPLRKDKALFDHWKSVEFLFQLTDAEVRSAGGQNELTFDSNAKVDYREIHSYLILALELKPGHYTRTNLATITREINRLFDMPALILFRHGDSLTLSVIDHRPHKRDESKDVLEKITLIKDVRFAMPHRAHIEILHDLSLGELRRKDATKEITSFVALHAAWRKTLNIQTLNQRFFEEIRNWFYWARLNVAFPKGARKDADGRDSESIIRLLTRMIFCWFLREKGLIPPDLFDADRAGNYLKRWAPDDADRHGRYYKAILQNLFFATLSTPVSARRFRASRNYKGRNKDYGDQAYFRHCRLFKAGAAVENLYRSVPFLNGGLFECLDRIPGRDAGATKEVRVDGFSDVKSKQPLVPDCLFFGAAREVFEIAPLLDESRAPKARGLIRIFEDYKFTIEENTPLEEDIALDPELLGRAFENLLAAVNPETGAVARKSTGSFYTPREIVNYMVDEALIRRLESVLRDRSQAVPNGTQERLHHLFAETEEKHQFSDDEVEALVAAISRLRILDPACGSGAFPMGILHRLVHVLRKLDPGNERWKREKLAALPPEMRQKAEETFVKETFDYTRKLELIKDCIHGVDIQPTAIQISKLRFFLSLVIEQHDGRNIRPLPNLETKFVCANSLLGLPRPKDWELFHHQVEPKERALLEIRSCYFYALTRAEKEQCRESDAVKRAEIAAFIEGMGGSMAHQLASEIAAWDPYRTDDPASFFDPESMFGVRDGFDITIGNPPYVRADEQSDWNRKQRQEIFDSKQFETLWEKWDLYVPFIERGYKLLRPGGVSTMIVSDAFCHSKYAQKPQNWYLQNARILRLDFCSDLKIFDAAVHNLIYFFQRPWRACPAGPEDWGKGGAGAPFPQSSSPATQGRGGLANRPERRLHTGEFGNVTLLPTDEQAKLTYRAFFPEDATMPAFACKSAALSQVFYISTGMECQADEKRAQGSFSLRDLVSDVEDVDHPIPFLEAKHLDRWIIKTNKWFEWGTRRSPSLLRAPKFKELFEVPEKCISIDMAAGHEQLSVAYDDKSFYHNHSAWCFVPWHSLTGVRNNSLKKAARYKGEKPPRPDLPQREELEKTSRRFEVKYLLAVMNSSVARDFLRANRRSNIHLYPDDWKKLPIPDVDAKAQTTIVKLVDKILAAKAADPSADVSALEREIDQLVYQLYGLTEEEIKIVEGSRKE